MGQGPELKLLYFFMNSYLLQDWVELLQFQSFGGVFSVFGCDVSRSTWHARVFVLCTLHNHLYSVAFLSHLCVDLRDCDWII